MKQPTTLSCAIVVAAIATLGAVPASAGDVTTE